jgi:hypothetical protein
MKYALVLLGFVAATATLGADDKPMRDITPEEARQVALAALSPEARRLPGLELESLGEVAGFYGFTVAWGVPRGEAGGTVEHLAVDHVTADVWSGVVCREEKSSSLSKVQATIRKRIGLTDKVHKQLRRPGPMC